MDLARFVRVIAVVSNKKVKAGTGYLLSPTLVLTAAHVVEEAHHAGRAIVLTHEHWGQLGRMVRRVPWCREVADLDVALLEIEPDPFFVDRRWQLEERPLEEQCAWESRGFASGASPRVRCQPISGTAWAFEKEACWFEVTLEAAFAKKEHWEGISGAPVFVRHSLIGVVGEVQPDNPRRTQVVAMPRLLREATFRAALGPLPDTECRNLIAALEVQLDACPAAAASLIQAGAREHPEWQVAYATESQPDRVRRLLDSLCAAPLLDVLLALKEAHRNQRKAAAHDSERRAAHLGAARAIRDLALLLAPWLHHRTRRLQFARVEGDLLALPVRHDTLIEVAMAGVGDRGALFEAPLAELGEPRAVPARSAPNLGIALDVYGHEFVRSIALSLATELGCGPKVLKPLRDEGGFISDAVLIDTDRSAFDRTRSGEALRSLNERIAFKARYAEPPFRLYLIVDRLENQGKQKGSVVLLRRCLDQLEVVLPQGDLGEDEQAHLSISGLLFHDHQMTGGGQ